MKRFLTMLLALCLLCGAFALAEPLAADGDAGSTEVTYTITKDMTYTLTIPPDVTIDPASNRGELKLTLETPNFNVRDGRIIVFLSGTTGDSHEADGGKFYLTNTADSSKTVLYRLYGSANPTTPLQRGFSVLEWTCNGESVRTQETLTLVAEPTAELPAGTYKDTLTFEVEVSDPNNPVRPPEREPVAP